MNVAFFVKLLFVSHHFHYFWITRRSEARWLYAALVQFLDYFYPWNLLGLTISWKQFKVNIVVLLRTIVLLQF